MLRFSKAKCVERLKNEGLYEHLSKDERNLLTELNGRACHSTVFAQHVLFETLVYITGKDGIGYYVRKEDCNEV